MEDNPWTEARVAELRCLISQQLSYTTIARRLGVSRNAAIGKAKRLKINPIRDGVAEHRSVRAEQIAVGGRGHTWPAGEPSVTQRSFRCEALPPTVSSDPLNLRMDQLRFFHCRYITNDDMRAPTYCARSTAEGTSWCDFHLARVRAPIRSDDIPLAPSFAHAGTRRADGEPA